MEAKKILIVEDEESIAELTSIWNDSRIRGSYSKRAGKSKRGCFDSRNGQ